MPELTDERLTELRKVIQAALSEEGLEPDATCRDFQKFDIPSTNCADGCCYEPREAGITATIIIDGMPMVVEVPIPYGDETLVEGWSEIPESGRRGKTTVEILKSLEAEARRRENERLAAEEKERARIAELERITAEAERIYSTLGKSNVPWSDLWDPARDQWRKVAAAVESAYATAHVSASLDAKPDQTLDEFKQWVEQQMAPKENVQAARGEA